MEPQRHTEPHHAHIHAPTQVAQHAAEHPTDQSETQKSKKSKNPARKWLMVSAFGLLLSISSLSVHALRGGSASQEPLPKKVLSQVFGFTPYYFAKNTPPDRLKLDINSPKFIGNALNFTMVDSKHEKITVVQKTAPASDAKKMDGQKAQTPLGTATIKTGGGHVAAELVTSDGTYISLSASDFISSGTLIDVYGNLKPAPKGIDALKN